MVDENGHLHRDQADVTHIFTDHMMKRYAHIPTAERHMKDLVQYGMNNLQSAAVVVLDAPITMDEFTVQSGKENDVNLRGKTATVTNSIVRCGKG